MMLIINEYYNKGFKWKKAGNVVSKGYAFIGGNNYIDNEKFSNCIEKHSGSIVALKAFISELSGSFSFVYEKKDFTLLAVDIVRTFPLFYTIIDKELVVSNSYEDIAKLYQDKISEFSYIEFKQTGYVTGERTLYCNVYQVEAGSIVIWDNNEIKKIEYFSYNTNIYNLSDINIETNELSHILYSVGKRLVNSLNGSTAVIPLSGGYDSRLVACLLKNFNYKNVICFTYGRKESVEVKMSKTVAEKLGYKWIFIEYSKTFIEATINSLEWKDYLKFGFNGVSLPCIQDFFAIKKLHDDKLIPSDSIIIPGHSGDFFAGTHTMGLNKHINSVKEIKQRIVKHNYVLHKNVGNFAIKTISYNNINIIDGNMFAHSLAENWDMKNRQAKFIINANRVYEYYGYEHRIPLWDKELVEYFKYINIKFKNRDKDHIYEESNNLYDSTIMKYFIKYGVDFHKIFENKKIYMEYITNIINSIKFSLKILVPKRIFRKLNRAKKNSIIDQNNYITISRMLGYNLEEYYSINSVILLEIVKLIEVK